MQDDDARDNAHRHARCNEEIATLRAELAAVRGELAIMRPVVDAAVRWDDVDLDDTIDDLQVAIDNYRAALAGKGGG